MMTMMVIEISTDDEDDCPNVRFDESERERERRGQLQRNEYYREERA